MKIKGFSLRKEKKASKATTEKKPVSQSAIPTTSSTPEESKNKATPHEMEPRFSFAAAAAVAVNDHVTSGILKQSNNNTCFPVEEKKHNNEDELFEKRITPQTLKEPTMSDAMPTPSPWPMMEVTIDHDAIPPSPMRSPAKESEMYRQSSAPHNLLSSADQGEVSMRNQLWDAQRLVRVILGNNNGNELDNGSILQAIRAFAVMQQELSVLRKQQEQQDGDPPAILASLGSPATTTLASSSRNSLKTPQKQQNSLRSSTPESKINKKAIVGASKKIQSLEKELRQAKKTIETTQKEKRDLEQVNKYQQERLQKTIEEIDAAQKEVASLNKQSKEAEEKYHTLLEQMRQKLEETKRESEEKDRHISDMEQAQIQLQCSVSRVLNTAMLQKQNRVPNKEANENETIDVLNQRIANLEARNAEHHASFSLLQGAMEAMEIRGSSPGLVLQELQSNNCDRKATKPEKKSQQQSENHQLLATKLGTLSGLTA